VLSLFAFYINFWYTQPHAEWNATGILKAPPKYRWLCMVLKGKSACIQEIKNNGTPDKVLGADQTSL